MEKFLLLLIGFIFWIENSSGFDKSFTELADQRRNKFNLLELEKEQERDARFKRQSVVQKSNEQDSTCLTLSGQPGHCMNVMLCQMPELENNIWRIIPELCVYGKSSIGICCPDGHHLNSISVPQIITNINDNDDNSLNDETTIMNRPEGRGCGITTKRFPPIVDERTAEPDEWPWMAAILRHRLPNIHCGGVLITDRHVLTAAHCVNDISKEDIFVRLGEYDFQLINETRSRDFRVSNITYHVDFDPQTYQNDIALLRVERPTLFNTYIWPICLPPMGENWEGWNSIVTGWGTLFFGGPHSKVLMEVNLPVWKLSECEKLFVENIDELLLCAGAAEGRRDSCQGDSGGPLMVQLPNRRWIVIGIVSWGISCGGNHPGLYTRVDKYLPWIIQNTID